jgi:hypothetical protein
VGGGGLLVCGSKVTLVFCFGPKLQFFLLNWTWTKLNN